jgi:nucleoporin NUP159
MGANNKLQLLPTPWSKDNLPPSSASLLSIASKRGLIAAAGPDSLVIASTKDVREALSQKSDDDGVVTSFTPLVTIPTTQLRHVAFSSDEEFLVIATESGESLIVYNVDDAIQKKDPVRQIATGPSPIRALAPNPAPEYAHYFAAVLESGQLVIADVSTSQFQPRGSDNVTCAAWSMKGKAVIAGLKDGTAIQFDTSGKPVAAGTIPRPPDVDASYSSKFIYPLASKGINC